MSENAGEGSSAKTSGECRISRWTRLGRFVVRVAGSLLLVLGLVCTVLATSLYVRMLLNPDASSIFWSKLPVGEKLEFVMSPPLFVMWVVGGVGLLLVRNWGRRVTLIACFVMILKDILDAVVSPSVGGLVSPAILAAVILLLWVSRPLFLGGRKTTIEKTARLRTSA